MKSELLNNYFNDQCTESELKEVLEWFQTEEGREYLDQDIDEQEHLLSNENNLSLYKELDSYKLFYRIQLGKKKKNFKRRHREYLRVASIILIVALLSFSLHLINNDNATVAESKEKEVTLISYTTEAGQQKIFTLSDGTKIRLNEKSTLIVPEMTSENDRVVNLKGEAYFEVAKSQYQRFIVQSKGATVIVLGTKFNIKADTVANNVQVAVVEGKVALKSRDGEHSVRALLTRNDFGLLQLSSNRITIEKTRVNNHLSWMSHRLIYSGETLKQVSQQLEYLYNVEIDFTTQKLKSLKLTANFEKSDLETTIATIAKTFDIQYTMQGHKVTWKE